MESPDAMPHADRGMPIVVCRTLHIWQELITRWVCLCTTDALRTVNRLLATTRTWPLPWPLRSYFCIWPKMKQLKRYYKVTYSTKFISHALMNALREFPIHLLIHHKSYHVCMLTDIILCRATIHVSQNYRSRSWRVQFDENEGSWRRVSLSAVEDWPENQTQRVLCTSRVSMLIVVYFSLS